jgi:hypothetical protein
VKVNCLFGYILLCNAYGSLRQVDISTFIRFNTQSRSVSSRLPCKALHEPYIAHLSSLHMSACAFSRLNITTITFRFENCL